MLFCSLISAGYRCESIVGKSDRVRRDMSRYAGELSSPLLGVLRYASRAS